MDFKTQKKWEKAKKILCIRLDSMGDVLMTSPAIRALKESQPGREITLLTSPAGAEVAERIPEIDDVIVYEAPWMKATPPRGTSHIDYGIIKKLRQRGFDAAVIFTVYSQNPLPAAFLAYLADIPLRLGYSRENPYQLLTEWVRNPDEEDGSRHEVQRHLDMVETVGCSTLNANLSFDVTARDLKQVNKVLDRLGIERNLPWLVIHPGATAASRRYPPESYARVAQILALEHGFQIIFTGINREKELIKTIQSQVNIETYSLAGALSLGELGALLSITPLLISNNTGPAHIAAAVGTPIVELYALTNPQHTPWMATSRILFHDVPCKFCYKSVCPERHHHCLRLVSPSDVVDAVFDLLLETSPAIQLEESVL